MKRLLCICMSFLMMFGVSMVNSFALESDGMKSNEDGSFQLDAKVTHPNDYQMISGFEISLKILTAGNLGDTFPINALMVSKGAYTAADFTMSYEGGVPRYVGQAAEFVTFSDSYAGSMFFMKSMETPFTAVEEIVTLKYEGKEALFDDNNSVLTACGIFGTFEVVGVDWIFGEITETAAFVEPWPEKVETNSFMDIPTVENGTNANYIDIEVPAGEGPYPVIFWIHGGGWTTLDRKSCFIRNTMDYLLNQGFAVVSAEYTLSTIEGNIITSGYPQMIYDLKAAIRYLRANQETYNLDTRFIASMGESAGGHLAMLLGTTNGKAEYEDLSMGHEGGSSDVQAIISYFGPTNLVDLLGLAALGNDFTQEETEIASPYYQINENTPPLFITHGKNDIVVPVQQSYDMEEKAKTLIGAENVTAIYYEDAPHANVGAFDVLSAARQVETFLKNNLERTMARQNTEEVEVVELPNTGLPKEENNFSWTNVIIILALVASIIMMVYQTKKSKKATH